MKLKEAWSADSIQTTRVRIFYHVDISEFDFCAQCPSQVKKSIQSFITSCPVQVAHKVLTSGQQVIPYNGWYNHGQIHQQARECRPRFLGCTIAEVHAKQRFSGSMLHVHGRAAFLPRQFCHELERESGLRTA